jgi:hypothetical protein
MKTLLNSIGYMTEEVAREEGFTNKGSYFGIPIYVGDIDRNFNVAVKWSLLEPLFSLFNWIEGFLSYYFYEEQGFSFYVGDSILIENNSLDIEDLEEYIGQMKRISELIRSVSKEKDDLHDLTGKAVMGYAMALEMTDV